MNLSTRQKQAYRHRGQTCGCQGGRRVGEGRTGSLGLADANYYMLYIGWINNEVRLCSAWNCVQYRVINHKGKEYEKERICV